MRPSATTMEIGRTVKDDRGSATSVSSSSSLWLGDRALTGVVGVSVDNLDAACQRLEDMKVNWKKRLTDGRMKNVAFVLDPDGYWVEVVQNERFADKPNF
jgi:catechol 2,3-dioxygenase-like lactoylglutathione lyase family enzyme